MAPPASPSTTWDTSPPPSASAPTSRSSSYRRRCGTPPSRQQQTSTPTSPTSAAGSHASAPLPRRPVHPRGSHPQGPARDHAATTSAPNNRKPAFASLRRTEVSLQPAALLRSDRPGSRPVPTRRGADRRNLDRAAWRAQSASGAVDGLAPGDGLGIRCGTGRLALRLARPATGGRPMDHPPQDGRPGRPRPTPAHQSGFIPLSRNACTVYV